MKSFVRLMTMVIMALSLTVVSSQKSAASTCVYRVDITRPTDGDGSTWGTAYKDLGNAIAAASSVASASNPCQIWVAKGTYIPNTASRWSNLYLFDHIAIYGGFAGGETSLAQRNWEINSTILSGNINPGNPTLNLENVIHGTYSGSTAILDGFTIRDGYASSTFPHGGGIWLDHSSATLSNLVIEYNHATGNISAGAGGGGGLAVDGGSPILNNVGFYSNTSDVNGGCMYIVDGSNVTMNSGYIYNCSTAVVPAFQATTGLGGGVYKDASSTLSISHVVFSQDHADRGGGAVYTQGQAALDGVYFLQNSAEFGAGWWADEGTGTVTLQNSYFDLNTAVYRGGGMYIYKKSPSLTNVIFYGNDASDVSSSTGGAISGFNASPVLTNVTMKWNTAVSGGALFNTSNSQPIIRNTIIWNSVGGAIVNDPIIPTSNTTVYYSMIATCKPSGVWNSTCGTDGGNNISDTNPLFRLNTGEDLVLKPGSPLIDVGNNSCVSGVPFDYEGKQRIYNGIVDLGAYENYSRVFLPLLIR